MGIFIGSGFGEKVSIPVVGGGHTVVGVAGFPVILKTSPVHVDHGHMEAGEGALEHAVPFIILPKGEGRSGQIEEKGNALCCQHFHGGEMVVFIPAVFAEEDTGPKGSFFQGKGEGGKQVFRRFSFFLGQL